MNGDENEERMRKSSEKSEQENVTDEDEPVTVFQDDVDLKIQPPKLSPKLSLAAVGTAAVGTAAAVGNDALDLVPTIVPLNNNKLLKEPMFSNKDPNSNSSMSSRRRSSLMLSRKLSQATLSLDCDIAVLEKKRVALKLARAMTTLAKHVKDD